ncbi:MAG: hypothetical protein OHK0024_18210 [Thalassobaculales bacterium]
MSRSPIDHLHPRLRELFQYWDEKRGLRRMPMMREMSPGVLKPFLPNLLIIGVQADGDFVYHYYGTSFSDAFGVNMAGRSIDALPEAQRTLIRHEYDYVRLQRRPTWRIYSGDFDGRIVTWERLIVPLAGPDGQSVSTLLVGAYEAVNDGIFDIEEEEAAPALSPAAQAARAAILRRAG